MPVPTETFRSTRTLNLIFAASALALLLSVLWMVNDDYNREYRTWQQDGRVWQIAMTIDKQQAVAGERTQARARLLEARIAAIRSELDEPEVKTALDELESKIADSTAELDKLTLPTATYKGEIGPLEQQIQNALLEVPVDDELLATLRRTLGSMRRKYRSNNERIVQLQGFIDRDTLKRDSLLVEQTRLSRELSNSKRELNALKEKRGKLDPEGLWANLGDTIRDAPLLDWLNPYEKPDQIVVPQVLMDLNTHLIETIDRCRSCHVNIDEPAFSESNVLRYAQRQLAQARNQRLDAIGRYQPVVMLDFWVRAALTAGRPLSGPLDKAATEALEQIDDLRRQTNQPPLPETETLHDRLEQMMAQFELISTQPQGGDAAVPHHRWYRPLAYFLADVKAMLTDHLDRDQFKLLRELYRHELLQRLNVYRREQSLPELKASSVMLAHPKLDLFVNPDSAHSARVMGCTVCHEGSGQETIFEHTSHTPRDIWVDRKSGAPVPDFLIRQGEVTPDHGDPVDHEPAVAHKTAADASVRDTVIIIPASLTNEDAATAEPDYGRAHGGSFHDGGNLNHATDPAPFAPLKVPHDDHPLYAPPGDETGGLREVVRQQQFWSRQFGWAHTHYSIWEKPMHKLDYVESSCNKCHTEVFDLKDTAPRLFEGRKLFAQFGCVNCHSVTEIEDDLDLRRVGPSLVHVKHKLSKAMTASWIWAPKALRATTRMPHYFMQENNSSPLDILRTRVEVAAMAQYLLNAEPGRAVAGNPPVYAPKPHPQEPGDAERGRELFHRVGCLACHTNLNEHGRAWIVNDLAERTGLDEQQAREHHDGQMDTNQRHQYVLEHLEDRLQRTGPELSAVGTKLLAGRTRQQARDWLFNWLINPRGYHSYTIMPRLRLSDQESADITEYLLDQTRDDYEPSDFEITEDGARMLTELVVNIKAAQSTEDMAREEVADEARWPRDRKLMFLGEKMISHYGCNGCHLINGFEAAVSACTTLDGWGLKDPHKLDFGHYQHAFDRLRTQPWDLHRVRGHGLAADAPNVSHDNRDSVEKLKVDWEQIENERRPWLYHKLHNSRVYDRARTSFDGGAIKPDERIDVGRPYDKLKMPRFYLTDRQVRSLVTYVTSIRKPLVSPQLQEVSDDAGRQVTRGRQMATLYNCYGCHNIEGNSVHIHQYFGVYEDGRYVDDSLNWAPPRLLGQGGKTQGDWLFGFLQNVQPIRPWLRIRMPSFPMTEDHARTLADYFAGHSRVLSRYLDGHLKVIDDSRAGLEKQFRRDEPKGSLVERLETVEASIGELRPDGDGAEGSATEHLRHLKQEKADLEFRINQLQRRHATWFESDVPDVAAAVDRIRLFALSSDLVVSEHIDPRHEEDDQERRNTWDGLLAKVRALVGAFNAPYPYTPAYDPDAAQGDPERAEVRFARGKELFTVMGCMGAACHRVGDDHLLARNNMLVPTSLEDSVDEEDEEDYEDDEEEGYGDDDYADEAGDESPPVAVRPDGPPLGAPNLRIVARRLQADWVRQWLVHSGTIQPGTRMQQYFKDGKSEFATRLPQERAELEKLFGTTAKQQQDLLMDFLYSVGPRRVTLAPDGKILEVGSAAEVKLTALEPPPVTPGVDAPAAEAPDPP